MKFTQAEREVLVAVVATELKERKWTFIIAAMPWSLALGLYWSLAIHIYLSLGNWPEMIGTRGFAEVFGEPRGEAGKVEREASVQRT